MSPISTGKLAKEYGVSSQTIRRWIKLGEFEGVSITKGGQFRVAQTIEFEIGYVRVSSKKQQSSLAVQRAIIESQYPGIEIVSDIGSGFNFKRRGFVRILERSLRGEAIRLVVSDQDRLTRVGFEFIRFVVESSGGQIVSVNIEEKPTSKFDTSVLIGFITSFCNSYYGKRGSSRRKKDSDLPKRTS